MGNGLIRALQRPLHDCAKYVLDSCDSECELSDCCPSKLATYEVDDDSPDIQEARHP